MKKPRRVGILPDRLDRLRSNELVGSDDGQIFINRLEPLRERYGSVESFAVEDGKGTPTLQAAWVFGCN
jgi:hypothetical protein